MVCNFSTRWLIRLLSDLLWENDNVIDGNHRLASEHSSAVDDRGPARSLLCAFVRTLASPEPSSERPSPWRGLSLGSGCRSVRGSASWPLVRSERLRRYARTWSGRGLSQRRTCRCGRVGVVEGWEGFVAEGLRGPKMWMCVQTFSWLSVSM